jgi:hypothetical protein
MLSDAKQLVVLDPLMQRTEILHVVQDDTRW